MQEQPQRNYYAIIPANVRYDKELTPNAKLLYGEVTALCNERGYCWAGNAYFADLYSVSKVTISKWVNQLVEKGYLTSEIKYKEGTKEIVNRYLRIVNDPIKENVNTPIKEKFKDNITSFNNTNNITSNKEINVDDKSPTTPARKKRVYEDYEEPLVLAKYLHELIKRNNEYAKEPNFQTWANDIRLMHESDGLSYEVIKNCIVWCQQDSFWYKNILSAKKLREKFPTLYLQAKDKKGVKPNGSYQGNVEQRQVPSNDGARKPKSYTDKYLRQLQRETTAPGDNE